MAKTLKIGLTGGIGAGKTTISRIFNTLGIPIFNADVEAKNLMVTDTGLKKSLLETFGKESYLPDGQLNRQYLANQVFSDPYKLSLLNNIVHPLLSVKSERWFNEQNTAYAIEEAAILFESGMYHFMDKNITVYAPLDFRIKRVMERDKCTKEHVEARIKNQMSEEEKIFLSDFVIYNDNTMSLIEQVIAIHNQLLCSNVNM